MDWDSYIISTDKTASKVIEALICSIKKFLSPEVTLHLYNKSTIYGHVCNIVVDAPSYAGQICRIAGLSLAASLEPLSDC